MTEKDPHPSAEMLQAIAVSEGWGWLRLHEDLQVHAVNKDAPSGPICSGDAAYDMCERGWMELRRWRGKFEFQVTGEGRKAARLAAANAKKRK